MAEERVALISGARRGIGKAIAERLFRDGWKISLGLRQPQDDWTDGVAIHTHPYDALQGGEAEWVDTALARFGRIDAVVANAGVMVAKSVIDIDDASLDAMWAVNVRAPQRLAKYAFPALSKSGSGRIAIIASLSGKRVASVDSSAYALTKHAAVALAHGLRQAGFEQGIRATAICPGFVSTDMGLALAPEKAASMTSADEVADVVAYAINLPNRASVAEITVNWRAEQLY
ncbi:SDR family NAD(P)-dependent oxidoreductase [Rhizobium sp. RM]|uniref:SDR family NAD(P)-dependent oxidoreductase n=1 Tax=Rhizobium sp. RM TaxID=2748079 RepID=UPI00110D3132|nr:SDR family NAD(P)-dependent oxidoreductase [Rhizobium sp. RM]NWJ25748.1 SDR family NAD(P)-dependent oxidoreductase [Rhizobium sp. RM]TMV21695.1 SDR family NAD(P)-dependent oxidoreductase [Rhizobium sp. Td3]